MIAVLMSRTAYGIICMISVAPQFGDSSLRRSVSTDLSWQNGSISDWVTGGQSVLG